MTPKKHTSPLALLLLLLLATAPGRGQESSAKSTDGLQNQPLGQPERIRIFISIGDKQGKPATGISKEDLVVFEDKKPAVISELRPASDEPLTYALLLDLSSSSRSKQQFIKQLALQIFDALNSERTKTILVLFTGKVGWSRGYVARDDMSKALDQTVYGGGTALYDAIDMTCRERFRAGENDGSGRRALIVISDGDDNQSHVTREQAVEAALRSGVTIHALSLFSSRDLPRSGLGVLTELSERTGGIVGLLDRPEKFSDALLHDLRNQYVLVYSPLEVRRDGRFHSIKIKAPNRKDLHVVAPVGYYAPSDPSIPLETKH